MNVEVIKQSRYAGDSAPMRVDEAVQTVMRAHAYEGALEDVDARCRKLQSVVEALLLELAERDPQLVLGVLNAVDYGWALHP